ncbi:histone H1.1-like [Vespa velutina]|uniref:histone H1.1-like n=1 Tax=Vespa velutina TaxID=202808 RepID=UPI001FB2EA4C|nr:histone H1.1-like [Vespa velutina]
MPFIKKYLKNAVSNGTLVKNALPKEKKTITDESIEKKISDSSQYINKFTIHEKKPVDKNKSSKVVTKNKSKAVTTVATAIAVVAKKEKDFGKNSITERTLSKTKKTMKASSASKTKTYPKSKKATTKIVPKNPKVSN